MKIFSAGLCAAALLLAAESCSKKSDPEPEQPLKTETISASAWTYQDAGVDLDRNGAIDPNGSLAAIDPSLVPPCRTDNLLTFRKDNTGTVDEGTTKCNAADAAQTSFNWNFADGEANLLVSNNVFSLLNGKSKILSLTATSFSLTRDTVMGGFTVPVVVLLKH